MSGVQEVTEIRITCGEEAFGAYTHFSGIPPLASSERLHNYAVLNTPSISLYQHGSLSQPNYAEVFLQVVQASRLCALQAS